MIKNSTLRWPDDMVLNAPLRDPLTLGGDFDTRLDFHTMVMEARTHRRIKKRPHGCTAVAHEDGKVALVDSMNSLLLDLSLLESLERLLLLVPDEELHLL